MHLYGGNLEMFIFLKLLKLKSCYLGEMFNPMRQWFYINVKLASDLSSKATHLDCLIHSKIT